jgi:hydroxymethylpyrimidine/phosphomethylpyrimidine kinase
VASPSIALTIAGSDPCGGAGLQADLKTFHQFGVYGQAVVTLITVQNTVRVSRVEVLAADLVIAQLKAVLEDIPPHAAKLGALGNQAVIEAVASVHLACPLVVDPVMISKHGARLMTADAVEAFRRLLVRQATLLTPNLQEASALTGRPVSTPAEMRSAAQALGDLGARSVLVKGGHLEGEPLDVLLHAGEFVEFPVERILTRHTHGTGCTYSAAIAAGLASGVPLPEAVWQAKQFVHAAIRTNPGLGRGCGPVNFLASYN